MADLLTFEIRYADRTGENYFARFNERHRWSIFPRMTREEVMLILQWDSAGAIARGAAEGGPATFSLHSAVGAPPAHTATCHPHAMALPLISLISRTQVTDPRSPPDAVRESIEVRCVVVFDE